MESNFKVNMNEYLPLRDVVFNTLRQAILRGELKPGERLMEIQLANKLGVSRTPIREAIRKLELEGLVLMIPRKGAEVAEITEKNMRDVLEVRKALEELAVQLACDKITKEEIEEMKKAAEDFKKILKSKDITEIAEADVRFHDIIYMATDNQKLIQLLNNLREQMYRYRVEYLKREEAHPQLIAEHAAIIEYISKGEKKAATDIMCKRALKPYIENLNNARGLIDCPEAFQLALKLKDENAEFSRLSQDRVYENLSFRANVIAYLKACVLYVANGCKWEPEIDEFIRWSERYDLYCKMRFFGDAIKRANDTGEKSSKRGPSNMLMQLPDEFTYQQVIDLRVANGMSQKGTSKMLGNWKDRHYIRAKENDSVPQFLSSSVFIKLKFRKENS